jgi:hypothetical protein
VKAYSTKLTRALGSRLSFTHILYFLTNCDGGTPVTQLGPFQLEGRDYEVAFTATDTTGNNVLGCSVPLHDPSPATLTCPPNLVLDVGFTTCKVSLTSSYKATVRTKCGTLLDELLPTTTSYGPGEYAIPFTYTNQDGSVLRCTRNVSVRDRVPPIVECRPMTLNSDANCIAQIPDSYKPYTWDNCGSVTMRLVGSTTLSGKGDHSIRYTATDSANTVPISCT